MLVKLFPPVGHVLLSSKTYFTKMSIKGGPCNIHFFPLILPAIAAKQCIKFDILATSLLYSVQIATQQQVANCTK